jgi:hypothetical protein
MTDVEAIPRSAIQQDEVPDEHAMDGSLFVAVLDNRSLKLYEDLLGCGLSLGLSTTNFTYRAPFLRYRGAEAVGEREIRALMGSLAERSA